MEVREIVIQREVSLKNTKNYLIQPEAWIYDPKSKNVSYLGVIDDFKKNIDNNRFELIKNKEGKIEIIKPIW